MSDGIDRYYVDDIMKMFSIHIEGSSISADIDNHQNCVR